MPLSPWTIKKCRILTQCRGLHCRHFHLDKWNHPSHLTTAGSNFLVEQQKSNVFSKENIDFCNQLCRHIFIFLLGTWGIYLWSIFISAHMTCPNRGCRPSTSRPCRLQCVAGLCFLWWTAAVLATRREKSSYYLSGAGTNSCDLGLHKNGIGMRLLKSWKPDGWGAETELIQKESLLEASRELKQLKNPETVV